MWRHCGWPFLLVFLIAGNTGCNIVGAIAVMTAPPQMQDAEVEIAQGRLGIFIEYARPSEENPVFTRAFRERLVEVFREQEVNTRIVPEREILELRQKNADFRRWSLPKVGRELNVEQLLYIRIERLNLHTSPANPLLEPVVEMRMKLIDPHVPGRGARLWPPAEEREGRLIRRARQIREASDPLVLDAEASKLGRDAAWLAAKPFYRYDLEEKDDWEP